LPWSTTEVALARAIGSALVDIILQVQAVRLLIAEHQLVQIRAMVTGAREPVAVTDADGRVLFANTAIGRLAGRALERGEPVQALFRPAGVLAQALADQRGSPQSWRRELELHVADGEPLPVSVRLEVVNGRDGRILGHLLTLEDLRERHRATAARLQLETALRQAACNEERQSDEVVAAILTNASLAAMDIADARGGPPVTPLLEELEASARRATSLYAQIRRFES
jgi:transcriptional regulator of aromatic amino acid metabolism